MQKKWRLPMGELKEAVKESYLEYCCSQYFAGWDAQVRGEEIPNKATEMFRDGYADSYKADQIINARVSYE